MSAWIYWLVLLFAWVSVVHTAYFIAMWLARETEIPPVFVAGLVITYVLLGIRGSVVLVGWLI